MNQFGLISRRRLFLGAGALFAWAHLPKAARAEGRDPRFLVIVLRGALDGLATVAPYGDPDWTSLRGNDALTLAGDKPALKLDDFFALHPAMPSLQKMYQAGHATIVHAVASPYRDRSHFDGQDVLESGFPQPGSAETGWLNRALASLEAENGNQSDPMIAVGPVTPLVARGPAPILVWAPEKVMPASDDTMMRLLNLYKVTDPKLAQVLEDRMNLTTILSDKNAQQNQGMSQNDIERATKLKAYFVEAATGAAKVLSKEDGPRIGALALEGWDTHAAEGITSGRLAQMLASLDAALAAVQSTMGPAWGDTVVAVVTEFGRTAHINGTAGTDHGTATVALLAGGALKGGHVIADWPGLKAENLYEGRDLKPTTELHAVLKGVMRDHLKVEERALAKDVFPGSDRIKPMAGLVA
jgi:uncharacterized protein (DUF1501 family)